MDHIKKKICPFSKCCSIEVQQEKNMSHILTKSKKKNVPCQNVAQLRYNKKKLCPLSKYCLIELKQRKNMSHVIVAHLVTFSNFCD